MSLNSALMFNRHAEQLTNITRVGHRLQTQPANEGDQSWWFWLLLLIILILVVYWLLQRETTQAPVQQPAQPKIPVTAAVAAIKPTLSPSVPAPAIPVVPTVPTTTMEDLTKIEGIGPKIHGVLHAAGIKTFADLSKAEVRQLRQMLVGIGMRVNDPTTWPEQAALAAAGKWTELQKMQEELNGGRRV